MKQKIPKVFQEDIDRIIRRDFPKEESLVKNLLQKYTSNEVLGRNRVLAAILKLADNRFDQIEIYTNQAVNDYRDVLALAECPNYQKVSFSSYLSEKEKEEIANNDWENFQKWFNRK